MVTHEMDKAKFTIIGIILMVFMFAAFSLIITLSFSENIQAKRVEKYVEIAEKAGEKAENLLNLIQSNPNISSELDLTEVEENLANGQEALTNAKDALRQGDLEDAFANAMEAFQIFRNIFKTLHSMLRKAGYDVGDILNAPGLIVAMNRALQRIERLREIMPEDSDNIIELLDDAENLLNIELAKELLQQGKVNETAHRLAEANKRIAQIHRLLKNKAKELNSKRITGFIHKIENFYKKLERQVNKLKDETLKMQLESILDKLDEAKRALDEGDNEAAILCLNEARKLLENVELSLRQLKHGHGRRP